MMPGAKMSESLSAKWVMNVAILLNVIASILSPICASGHYLLFAFMRVIQGIGGVRIFKPIIARSIIIN